MIQKFLDNNYEIVNFEEIADIYIINTCTVTNISDKKSRQMIRRARNMNNKALIVAVGCYAQVAKNELEKIEEIDLILGTNEKNNIVENIENHIKKTTDVMQTKEFKEFGNVVYTEKTRAVIKVQDGCDRFCSYCIIPYARGRVRSRKIENIIREIEAVVEIGIKEVVITGIHIASYGKDFTPKKSLIELLESINNIDGLERIRLGSIEPTIITNEFVKRLKKLDKICNHFHLSLQSGCDDTLKRMNRKYTISEFKNSVEILRNEYKSVAITTDVIVGFPGETDEEFEITYNNLKEINFYNMHIFKYSARKGTKAASMKNQIKPEIKEKRSKILLELTKKQKYDFEENYIGQLTNVLWEEDEGEYVKGHTSNYMVVYCKKNTEFKNNKSDNVCLKKHYKDGLLGEVINL